MRKNSNFLLLASAAMVFGMATGAAAVEVEITGSECPLTVIEDISAYENSLNADSSSGQEAEAETEVSAAETSFSVSVELDSLEALGIVNDKYIAVSYDDGKTGYLTVAEAEEKLPGLMSADLQSVTDFADLGIGSSGENTSMLQQALTDLDLLEGGVDGAFGEGTSASVKEFQRLQGLEETGTVDAFCWFRLMEEAGGSVSESGTLTLSYPPVYRLEDKFRAIENDVEDVEMLRRFLEPEWVFTYDTFAGTGRIEAKEPIRIESLSEGKYAADRLTVEASVYVDVRRTDKNIVNVRPVIEIRSTGSQRVYIKDGLLKAGYAVTTLEKYWQEGAVDGLASTEVTLLALDEDAFDVIADGVGEEMILRAEGLHGDYDFDLTAQAKELEDFLAGALDINQKERHLVIEE